MKQRCVWRAHWIWAKNLGADANALVYARRGFDLAPGWSRAELHIAADTYYRLHLNGVQVGRGPARSQAFWMSYDSYDVTSLLRSGRNALAVEANGHFPPRGAFIAQLEVYAADDAPVLTVATGPDWRVIAAPGWAVKTPHTSHWDASEVFDARRTPAGWTEAEFDDSAWEAPLDRGKALTAPYYQLEPRDIPHLEETERLADAVLEVGEVEELQDTPDPFLCANPAVKLLMDTHLPARDTSIKDAANVLRPDEGPVTVEQRVPYRSLHGFYEALDQGSDLTTLRSAYVVLDFGRLLNGHVRLDVEGDAGNVVDVAYGQTLTRDGRVLHYPYQENMWGAYVDRYVLRDGRQQWESFYWRNFRYVELVFRRLDRPLKLHRFSVQQINHPVEQRGRFACSDETLNRVWDTTTRTVRLCLTDAYMDNPFREKGIWSGDVSVIILAAFAAFGDLAVTRRYLRLFARGQLEPGFFPSSVAMYPRPAEQRIYIYHNMQYALRVGEYFEYGGDRGLVKEIYPALMKFVRWLAGYRNERGLLQDIPMTPWIDWAPNDLRGAVLVHSALYYGILTRVAAIARELGRGDEEEEALALAEPIPRAIHDCFWNEQRGMYADCFADGRQSECFSEHTNYTVLCFDLAPAGAAARVLANLADPGPDVVQVEPSYMYHPLQALFRRGASKQAMDFMRRRYGRLFRRGAETLWEEWSYRLSARTGTWYPRYRSLAQGAGCCASYVLSTEVLGVQPTAPGFGRFRVRPRWGDLAWAEGVVPAPVGDVFVHWAFEGDEYRLTVGVPDGAEAEVHLPPGRAALLDGKPITASAALRQEAGVLVYAAGPGRREFVVRAAAR